VFAPSAKDQVRIFWLAEAAVIATQCTIKITFFNIDVVPRNGTTVTQIESEVEQVVVRSTDSANPEWHDLHKAASANRGDGVFLEAAFNLNQAQHHLRIQPGT